MSDPSLVDERQLIHIASVSVRQLDGLGDGFVRAFHKRERDFLRLGEDLAGFAGQASQVSALSAELVSLASGEQVLHASETLASHLNRLNALCDTSQAGQEGASLDRVADVSVQLAEIMKDFARLVKHLSMLGIATRIESARLGSHGMGFSTLADDVEKLAGKIVASSEAILTKSQDVTAQCKEAAHNLKEMDHARTACSLSAMNLLQADLHALDNLVESSRAAAAEISGTSERVVASISEAVHSMQFHDIIRQQLEHVQEACDQARQLAASGPAKDGEGEVGSWTDLAGWVHAVLTLQRSQLGDARCRFASAMQKLQDSLEGIATEVHAMSDEAGEMISQESGQGGLLKHIEAGVGQIAASLRDFSQLEKRMAEVISRVSSSIGDMSHTAADIEEVGAEIELIALNASVKAAHTGEEGKALGVLASAIQKLSADARRHTLHVLELLANVDSVAKELDAALSAKDEESGLDMVTQDLDREVASLRGLEEQSSQAALRVRNDALALSEGIGASVASLDFQYELLDAMTAAETAIQDLLEELTQALPSGFDAANSPKLRQLLERYTMEAERLVHERALGNVSGQEGGDPDDNIELF